MKASAVDGVPTVKLSDVEGKHTGPIDKIEEYKTHVKAKIGRQALRQLVAA